MRLSGSNFGRKPGASFNTRGYVSFEGRRTITSVLIFFLLVGAKGRFLGFFSGKFAFLLAILDKNH